jgi:origin recognition complex subunit 2
VKQSGALALNSLNHVFASLTPNAKEIYLVIARYQVEALDDVQDGKDKDVEESGYRGIAFNDLYRKCKGAFLVNSDLTLRAQLIEFKDHKLVIVRKGTDGYDYLTIPLNILTLREFMDDQERSKEP